jgi:transmembrane sensor
MSHTGSRPLVEHALSLIAGAEVERPEQAQRLRAELDQWRVASSNHEDAYERALRQWQALGAAGPQLRSRFAEPSRAAKRRKGRAGPLLAVAAFLASFAGLVGWHLKQPVFDRAVQTGTAQLAQVPLPEGGRIDLNARTDLRVTLYRDRRTVELKRGEARFEVAFDPSCPFRVETREGVVEVVGTAFVVSDRGDGVTVDVEHGRVRFLPAVELAGITLRGGERVTVRHGVAGSVEHIGQREIAPWRDGWLVFENERLADALQAINAFRTMPIALADEHAGTLRLTGRFRATDSHGLLAALPRILPVHVVERADGSAEISSR